MNSSEENDPARMALLGYMEWASEERWCAGWLRHLHEALQGDPAYDWLVSNAGGTWAYPEEAEGEAQNVNGRMLVWVPNEQPA